jgi:small nuclear ribonucleoprotein (snRNP)-like protein
MSAAPPNKNIATHTRRGTAHQQQSQQHSKTLGSLLRYWEGLHVAVEVKTNGRLYSGTLAAADHDMTVTLHDCTVTRSLPALQQPHPQSQQNNKLPSVQIRGSQVRYIHFLDHNVNLAAVVQQGVERERAAAQKYKRGIRKEKS